jgi:5'-nucleotidase
MVEGLYAQLPHAKFEFLSANYDFKNTVMDGQVKPYKILKNGIKVGVLDLGLNLQD